MVSPSAGAPCPDSRAVLRPPELSKTKHGLPNACRRNLCAAKAPSTNGEWGGACVCRLTGGSGALAVERCRPSAASSSPPDTDAGSTDGHYAHHYAEGSEAVRGWSTEAWHHSKGAGGGGDRSIFLGILWLLRPVWQYFESVLGSGVCEEACFPRRSSSLSSPLPRLVLLPASGVARCFFSSHSAADARLACVKGSGARAARQVGSVADSEEGTEMGDGDDDSGGGMPVREL